MKPSNIEIGMYCSSELTYVLGLFSVGSYLKDFTEEKGFLHFYVYIYPMGRKRGRKGEFWG